jgi:hypothetical protein
MKETCCWRSRCSPAAGAPRRDGEADRGRGLLAHGSGGTEHDAAGEDGRLTAVVRRHLLLGGVDEHRGAAPAAGPIDGRHGACRVGLDGREGRAGCGRGRREGRAARVRGAQAVRGRAGAADRGAGHARERVERRTEPARGLVGGDAVNHREQLVDLALGRRRDVRGGRPHGRRAPGGAEEDVAGVDEEVELEGADGRRERGEPVVPLDARGGAGVVDRARGDARRKGERAAARAAARGPRGGVEGGEVHVELVAELDEGTRGAEAREGRGKEGDGPVGGGGKGGRHCVDGGK